MDLGKVYGGSNETHHEHQGQLLVSDSSERADKGTQYRSLQGGRGAGDQPYLLGGICSLGETET